MLSFLVVVPFSAIARIFVTSAGLALSCAMLKQITSSPEGKTVWEVSHEEADLIPLSW